MPLVSKSSALGGKPLSEHRKQVTRRCLSPLLEHFTLSGPQHRMHALPMLTGPRGSAPGSHLSPSPSLTLMELPSAQTVNSTCVSPLL